MRGANSPGEQTLRRLTGGLDMPPLERLPADHVISKAFYILRDFPGRWTGGSLWVEAIPPAPKNGAPPARGGDGVSPVVIGGNDWASAWAVDSSGRFTVRAFARRRNPARDGAALRHQSGDLCPRPATTRPTWCTPLLCCSAWGMNGDDTARLRPVLPFDLLVALAAVALLIVLYSFLVRARGAWARGLALRFCSSRWRARCWCANSAPPCRTSP